MQRRWQWYRIEQRAIYTRRPHVEHDAGCEWWLLSMLHDRWGVVQYTYRRGQAQHTTDRTEPTVHASVHAPPRVTRLLENMLQPPLGLQPACATLHGALSPVCANHAASHALAMSQPYPSTHLSDSIRALAGGWPLARHRGDVLRGSWLATVHFGGAERG